MQTRQDLPQFALRWLQALVHSHPDLAALALELGVEEEEDEDEDNYPYDDDFNDDDDDDVEWVRRGVEL